MKALTYHGPHHVQVENVPDPGVEQADDIILRITATAICGSDLHLYRGKIPQVKHGDIFGHEFMGEVVETGKDVKNLQKGDRVVIPFVIACGDCFFCRLSTIPQDQHHRLQRLNLVGSAHFLLPAMPLA